MPFRNRVISRRARTYVQVRSEQRPSKPLSDFHSRSPSAEYTSSASASPSTPDRKPSTSGPSSRRTSVAAAPVSPSASSDLTRPSSSLMEVHLRDRSQKIPKSPHQTNGHPPVIPEATATGARRQASCGDRRHRPNAQA